MEGLTFGSVHVLITFLKMTGLLAYIIKHLPVSSPVALYGLGLCSIPGDVCPQPFQLKAEDMENCTEVKSYDYFYGSEVSYALTLLFILGSIARKFIV